MTALTIELPDDRARRLQTEEPDLRRVIEAGLERIRSDRQRQPPGATEIYEFFAGNPSPEEIMALRPSKGFQRRIDFLLAKNKSTGLNEREEGEWAECELVEHLVRIAKAKAYAKTNAK